MQQEYIKEKLLLNNYKQFMSKIDDIYALNLLQSLLKDNFLSFTSSSMRPISIVHILNDIINNQRTRILEFGSGISSILVARLIKRNRLKSFIVSVDHDREWINVLNNYILHENLNDHIKLIYSPLKSTPISLNENEWYSIDILDGALESEKFDMMIVDGPPAYLESLRYARYPALPYAHEKLLSEASIYLDDANRGGEKLIIEKWCKTYNYKFQMYEDTLALLFKSFPKFGTDVFGNLPH